MRTILVLLLLANTLLAQPPASPEALNLGQAIGEGAAKSVADLEARIATLEQLVPPYVPTWTWPDHDKPNAFDRLRAHMAGENIHPQRNVAKWSRAELAFHHDCDHIEEYLAQGRGLPLLKDQRLRDWLRAKSPAKALPKKLGWQVKKIVLHRWVKTYPSNCPACDDVQNKTLPAAAADGVEVSIEYDIPGGQTVPIIEVCTESTCKRFVGYVSWQGIKNMMVPRPNDPSEDFIPAHAGD